MIIFLLVALFLLLCGIEHVPNLTEQSMTQTEREVEVLDGIKAQADFVLKYVQQIVTDQVQDNQLAGQVNAAIATKLAAHKAAFVAAVTAVEDASTDLTVELL